MIKVIADFHIHSKYSRACSPRLDLLNIARSCVDKGIDIVSTGDFTHPKWMEHIEECLEEVGQTGLYEMKNDELRMKNGESRVKFIFGTEIACIYKHKDKVRRLHLLIFAPSLDAAKRFNGELEARGCNLRADGRPIIGLSGKEVVKICLSIDPRMMAIPAHAWTPWFAVFGSKSGYDSLAECFEELAPEIFAIETGLSSDPPMNHRLSALDNITLVSNSDAHSLDNLGREANVLQFKTETEINYNEIRRILKTGDRENFLYTIEFYPEEGMYHFDGHRDCKFSSSPAETKRNKEICPVCKKKVTVGVLHRVDDLADREMEDIAPNKFIPHRYIVPIREIIGAAFGVGKKSKKVEMEYRRLVPALGSEFYILLHRDVGDIERAASDKNIALAIGNMRAGHVRASPGYDGVYGSVDVFPDKKMSDPKQTRLL